MFFPLFLQQLVSLAVVVGSIHVGGESDLSVQPIRWTRALRWDQSDGWGPGGWEAPILRGTHSVSHQVKINLQVYRESPSSKESV